MDVRGWDGIGGMGAADWGWWDPPHRQDLKTCTKSEHVLSSDLLDLVMIRSNTNRSMRPLSYFLSCLILPLSVCFLFVPLCITFAIVFFRASFLSDRRSLWLSFFSLSALKMNATSCTNQRNERTR